MAITLYTKPACVQCTATRKALDKSGVEYDVIDITENPDACELRHEPGLPAGARRHRRRATLVTSATTAAINSSVS